MRGFDADNQARIPARHVRRGLGSHVRQILFELSTPHSVADDVEKRENTCPGASDDGLVENGEITPARRAGVCVSAPATSGRGTGSGAGA